MNHTFHQKAARLSPERIEHRPTAVHHLIHLIHLSVSVGLGAEVALVCTDGRHSCALTLTLTLALVCTDGRLMTLPWLLITGAVRRRGSLLWGVSSRCSA
jgi:hypothetical protein